MQLLQVLVSGTTQVDRSFKAPCEISGTFRITSASSRDDGIHGQAVKRGACLRASNNSFAMAEVVNAIGNQLCGNHRHGPNVSKQ